MEAKVHVINRLFANEDDMIIVHIEDLDGYVHYEHFDDGTRQVYKMTKAQLYNEYTRYYAGD